MSRLTTAFIAATFTACLGGTGFAQAPQSNAPAAPAATSEPATPASPAKPATPAKPQTATTPAPASPATAAAPTHREKARADRKAAKQQKRAGCRTQAIAEKRKGEDRRDFMKKCESAS